MEQRPVILCVAGFDPSAGAGLLADIKTAEQHKVNAVAVCTAITLQTETEFLDIKWEKPADIEVAIEKMFMHYSISVVKIGIIENMQILKRILKLILQLNASTKIILDPVINSSTGYSFNTPEGNRSELIEILSSLYLITPNLPEMSALSLGQLPEVSASELSEYCNILLKGGHDNSNRGLDRLFIKGKEHLIEANKSILYSKHGSGCVLSSAIASELALGNSIINSCIKAKMYVEHFLGSNSSLIGFHNV